MVCPSRAASDYLTAEDLPSVSSYYSAIVVYLLPFVRQSTLCASPILLRGRPPKASFGVAKGRG